MNFEKIRLDKSMYKADGGFTKQLEKLDPSENYKNTNLEGLDAYQRQLKRFDIRVSGPNSDNISKFFATSDSAALFPEYVSRAVAQGSNAYKELESIIASTSIINSLDYRSITTDISGNEPPVVNEGGALPEVSITLNESLVKLKKRGQILSASYEAIKHQRADVITVALGQIGNSLAKKQMSDAVKVLLSGEGNVPAARTVYLGENSFKYDHLLDLWSQFNDFELNTLIASPKTVRELLALPEFRESTSGDMFISSGSLITPFGAKLVVSNTISDSNIIGLDKRYALEMVTTGGIQVEYDKLIDTQLERAAVSTTYGFSKLFGEATIALELEV